MRTNCIVWACALWWARHKKGYEGHVSIRKSRWGYFPHMCYWEYRKTGSVRVVSYKPRNPVRRAVPPPWFDGYVAWGDNPHNEHAPTAATPD